MKLQIKVDANGTILESKFKTFGCGSAIASSSVATEWVKGKNIDDALTLKNSDIAAHLKLPPVKLHCSMLAEDAIKAAVKDWKSKHAHKLVPFVEELVEVKPAEEEETWTRVAA